MVLAGGSALESQSAMTVDLSSQLAQLGQRAERYRGQHIGEQDTKAILIEPLLRILDWDVEDYQEVRREYRPKPTDNPVDYALFIGRSPRLFVEAKSLGSNLDDRKWPQQIMSYTAVSGVVEWVVLTDGDEYRLYNAHAPVPITEKLFRSVKLSYEGPQVISMMRLLSKERMMAHQIDALWEEHYVDRRVAAALTELFDPAPNDELIDLVRGHTTKLSREQVAASLARMRLRLNFGMTEQIEAAVPCADAAQAASHAHLGGGAADFGSEAVDPNRASSPDATPVHHRVSDYVLPRGVSARIGQILLVLHEVRHAKPMTSAQVTEVREQATERVAVKLKLATEWTVRDKYTRQLENLPLETFDRLVLTWLAKGDRSLRELLESHVGQRKRSEDLQAIRQFFEDANHLER